jgi:peptidoglycan/LPS O-acetylase OafA/YrhL
VTDGGGRFYLPQLDGLRFGAFLLVFIHHSPVFPGSPAAAAVKELGFVGVDLFFVLSAYLLIALLQREYTVTGATDFKKYFIRRALRIWPLFYVYIAACFLYFLLVNGQNVEEITGRTIGHLFLVDNFFTAFDGHYNPLNFTPHLWTIAFEEQIYVFIPLLFTAIVALRRTPAAFAIIAGAIAVAEPVLRWGLTRFSNSELIPWTVPFLHFDTIFAGLLLGAGVGSRLKEKIPGDVFVVIGLLILGVVFFVPQDSPFYGFLPGRTVYLFTFLALAFFLIVLGNLDGRSGTAWLLGRQPFVFLGRISYGLYVWHWVGNEFGPGLAPHVVPALVSSQNPVVSWASVVGTAFSLTVVLSVTSYFVLERPFLRIKTRFTVVPNRQD